MNILLLSESDLLPGAPRAAYRLLRGLLGAGADARMLVRRKLGDDPRVLPLYTRFERERRRLDLWLDVAPTLRYPRRKAVTWTTGWRSNGIERAIAALRPDVVHLHWVGFGFVPVAALARIGRPLAWTLRDMNAFTGGCHYDEGCRRFRAECGACPLLGSTNPHDLSGRTWRAKREAWRGIDLTVIGLSRWIVDLAGQSSLLRDVPAEVIPNGIDTRRYAARPKDDARRALGLPLDKRIILFGATRSTSDPRKGYHLLQAALDELARSGFGDGAVVAVFGADAPPTPERAALPTRYLGTLAENAIVDAYSAADAFVAPSTEEVFGNTVLESLACGTPCVAFDAGGIPDMIEPGSNGYLARPFEAGDLAAGIAWVLGDPQRRAALSRRAREKVLQEFDAAVIARRHLALYERMLARAGQARAA